MALTSWPNTPDSWLQSWVIWRFRGKPAPRPSGIPQQIPPYAWEFLKWCEWRRKAPPRPSRPDIVTKLPAVWPWDILKALMIAVPLVPPPPPPPPPPAYADSWHLPNPLMYTTWGWLADNEFRETDQALTWITEVCEVKTIALQIGQYAPDVPARCRAFGLKVALWGSPDANDQAALDAAQADGYMPQVEGPYEYQRTRDNLINGVGQGLSLATVTTLAGFESYIVRPDGSSSTVEAEVLIENGCTRAWVECYKQGGSSHFPISKMEWSAQHRGFPYFSPLIGLYWDVDVDEYQPELAAFGKQIGSYTAETMRPIDRAKFGALGT